MALSSRLAKLAMFLSQFDVVFVPQKAMKDQALANFLAAHPILDDFPIDDDQPDEEVFHHYGGQFYMANVFWWRLPKIRSRCKSHVCHT
jgi:hypothetical protein